MYEFERNEQTTKIEMFMNDLQDIEKNLHLALTLSDKEKVQNIIYEASCVLKSYCVCILYPFITIDTNDNLCW